MSDFQAITHDSAPAVDHIPGHHPAPFVVRLVCRSIRQAFGYLPHCLSNGLPAAGASVSSRPHQGVAHAGRCAQFAGGWAELGLLMHRASVPKHLLAFYGVSFSEVDTWK